MVAWAARRPSAVIVMSAKASVRPTLLTVAVISTSVSVTGRWKVVADQPTGAFELFDMVTDRTETRDLALAYPDLTGQLAQSWEDWKVRTHVRTWRDHGGYRRL